MIRNRGLLLRKIKLNTQLFSIFAIISALIMVIIFISSNLYIQNYSHAIRISLYEEIEETIFKTVSLEHNRLRSLLLSHAYSTELLNASEIHDTDWININANNYLYDNPSQKLIGSALINTNSHFSEVKGDLPLEFYNFLAEKLTQDELIAGVKGYLVSYSNHLYLVSIAGLTDTDHENLSGYMAIAIELDTLLNIKLFENFNTKATTALNIHGAVSKLATQIDDAHLQAQLLRHVSLHVTSIRLIDDILQHTFKLLLLVFSLYTLAATLMLFFLKRLTGNFESSIKSIKRITYNNYSQQLELNYSKDFYELGECINNLSSELKKRDQSISQKYLELISILVKTLEEVDVYTKGHSERVSHYSVELAKAIQYEDLESIRLSGLLHDIGKITVDTKILNKPSGLTPEEYNEIQKHPQTAYSILDMSETFSSIKDIVRAHHEKIDGTGYPFQLKGKDIPLGSKIVAIADVFDSLTSERSYRKPLPVEEAIQIIVEGSGSHFDPYLVHVFLGIALKIYQE